MSKREDENDRSHHSSAAKAPAFALRAPVDERLIA